MRIKRTWIGSLLTARPFARHEYTTGEDGVTRVTGYRQWVNLPMQVVGGKDDGRTVVAWLTPDDAEAHARALLEAAAEARKVNESL